MRRSCWHVVRPGPGRRRHPGVCVNTGDSPRLVRAFPCLRKAGRGWVAARTDRWSSRHVPVAAAPERARFFLGPRSARWAPGCSSPGSRCSLNRLTGRASDVGITLFCQFLPMLVLGVCGPARCPIGLRKQRMALFTQAGQAVQALAMGVITLVGHVKPPGDLHDVARARRDRGAGQPGPAWLRDRRRARGHLQRRLAQHRGDDRLTHLRPGGRGAARRSARTGLAVGHQRSLVRGGSSGRSPASTRRRCTSRHPDLAAARRYATPSASSPTAASSS